MNADFSYPPIDLAREVEFDLGGLRVTPSLRTIHGEEGEETIEPRVMQAMVALARQENRVVSRDQLVATCWDGRTVGDDAINRCISRLRRVGGEHRAFTIETIPRVGYRMVIPAA